MTNTSQSDLCIIGGGAGGLSVAATAVQMGLSVTLIEHHKMGGDCLNYGCVPSKALLAAGDVAHTIRHASCFGIENDGFKTNYEKVRQHIRDVQAQIAPNDSAERFQQLGVKVLQAAATFINDRQVQVGETIIEAKYFIIATGSSPSIPPIAGLATTPYLTNETIFDLDQQPPHLMIIGGGPIGAELAQAHARLGTKVTQLVVGEVLPKDDRELVTIVRTAMIKNGIKLVENIDQINEVKSINGQLEIVYSQQDQTKTVMGSHILVATGRQANVSNLNLNAANIDYTPRGIKVNASLRSSNKKVYAIGDVASPYQFTHVASYHASVVIRNILFKLPTKVDYRAIVWATYTDPEYAHVGIQIQQAQQQDKHYRITELSFTDNDRAQTEKRTEGNIKVITDRKGHILGCDIVGRHAGELILPWSLAIENKLSISKMASVIAPYPTLSDISKRVAGQYYVPTLFGKKVRWLVKWLNRLF